VQGPGVWVSTERAATESPIGNFWFHSSTIILRTCR